MLMKITDHIKNANGKTLFSFELIPPRKGKSIQELYNNIDPLMEFKPPFIDVTTSREEFVYIEKDGLLDKKVTRMRPGTIGICASIKHKYNVDTVPHVLCGGFTKEETEYLLVDCHYLGIHNLMALRGDAMREEQYFKPTPGGHEYALGLVEQIAEMNKGRYLNGMVETSDCSKDSSVRLFDISFRLLFSKLFELNSSFLTSSSILRAFAPLVIIELLLFVNWND